MLEWITNSEMLSKEIPQLIHKTYESLKISECRRWHLNNSICFVCVKLNAMLANDMTQKVYTAFTNFIFVPVESSLYLLKVLKLLQDVHHANLNSTKYQYIINETNNSLEA